MNTRTILRISLAGAMLLPLLACDDTAPKETAITWTQVSAGGNNHYQGTEDASGHTCGIQSDGTLWCWGSNGLGQLGTGSFASKGTPTQVGTDADWIYVDAGGARTCGIRGAEGKGTLWCWGSNRKFGDPDSSDQVWGLLGLGPTYHRVDAVNTPTQVGTAEDWTRIGLANHSACGIRDDGTDKTVWCWGSDSNGAVADGSSASGDFTSSPSQEDGEYTDWAEVTGSTIAYESNQQCGIREDSGDRTLWCWGYGGNGAPSGDSATQYGVATDWQSVTITGDENWCATKTDGTLYCAGSSNHGQPGSGAFAGVADLTQVGTDDTWTYVDAGRQSFCGINDGSLYCWGRDHLSELGLGADPSDHTECDDTQHGFTGTWDCNAPVLVDNDHTWVSVTGGRSQTCALTDEGALYCWGDNFYGAVGVPSAGTIVHTPTLVE